MASRLVYLDILEYNGDVDIIPVLYFINAETNRCKHDRVSILVIANIA